MFQRLLRVLEDMEAGRKDARDCAGDYQVLAYRPVDSWGEDLCGSGRYDPETELLEIARAPDLHEALDALIAHLAAIEQLEMAREYAGKLAEARIADDAADEQLMHAFKNESLRLFAYWALTFMTLDVQAFEKPVDGPDRAIVLFSWIAKPPYFDDGVTVLQHLGES